ncbi:hypothetical protein GCM10027563_24490 [Parasphingorhabdus pacifica]
MDAENTPWLAEVISDHGWLGIQLGGNDGGHAAWLLAQHAPLELQQLWLPLLIQSVKAGDAAAVDLAYLEDRVRIRQQLPQRHGTQWQVRDGQQRLFPLEDPNRLNELRKALDCPCSPTTTSPEPGQLDRPTIKATASDRGSGLAVSTATADTTTTTIDKPCEIGDSFHDSLARTPVTKSGLSAVHRVVERLSPGYISRNVSAPT